VVLCCGHTLLVRITYGVVWEGAHPPCHSYVGMRACRVLMVIIARESGVNVCLFTPLLARLLVTLLTTLNNAGWRSCPYPLMVCARPCPPSHPISYSFYSIVDFTYGIFIRQAYKAFPTHVCNGTHLVVLIGLYHYEFA
jgi:hypothetical protein